MSSLRFKSTKAQLEIVQWAQNNLEEEFRMEVAGNTSSSVTFSLFSTKKGCSPYLSAKAYSEFDMLGPAFTLSDEDQYLRITVRDPTPDESKTLLRLFSERARLLAKPVWPLWLATGFLFASLISAGMSIWFLTHHVHGYEKPFETLFDYICVLFGVFLK
jgi:hypothetical protein